MGVIDRYRSQPSVSLPTITPSKNCKLKLLRLERVDDWLLLEKEFIVNQHINDHDEKKANDIQQIEQYSGNPIIIGTLEEFIDDNHCIVSLSTSSIQYYVKILSFVNKQLLKPKSKVLLHPKMHHIVGILSDNDCNRAINAMKVEHAPKITYNDIGGLEKQIEEIKETVELPLTHPQIYEEIGIESPNGCILYGPPGTGKSLLAQAVANATKATFLHLCASELVSSTPGIGPKTVRQLFDTAKKLQPTIIFIDEIDAIGMKRYNASSSGEKAIQRTMMELLQQLQGFDQRGEIKIIMATNKIECLDSALIRAGRIDRKIEFPLPDFKTKLKIFKIHTMKMKLIGDCEEMFRNVVNENDDLSGADIKAICTEAGLIALRERRMIVREKDFEKGKDMVVMKKKDDIPEGMYL